MTVLSIGRHPECDIVIDDRSVSRRHAELVSGGDGTFTISDQGSKYGTFVKRGGEWKPANEIALKPDDAIKLGNYRTTPHLLQALASGDTTAVPKRGKTGDAEESGKARKSTGETSKIRKLSAIVAADLVSYSAMMASDETGTLGAIRDARQRVIEPRVERYQGRIFKALGDALMMDFPSVVKAVRCAADIQATLPTMTFGRSQVKLVFRMGINIGDVIIEEEDIFGTGVNIAARLEQIADPGGICISAFVYEQIKNQLDMEFINVGERELKNIPEPVQVYKVAETASGRLIPDGTG